MDKTTTNTKTIKISEEVFSTGPKKTRRNKKTNTKSRPEIDSSQIHAKLLNNIKIRNNIVSNRKQEPIAKNIDPPEQKPVVIPPPEKKPVDVPPPVDIPKSEYEESLNFMSTIKVAPPKPKPAKKNTDPVVDKIPPIDTIDPNPPIDKIPPLNYSIDTDIPHGCMKNGLKKTLKNINPSIKIGGARVKFDNLPDEEPLIIMEPMVSIDTPTQDPNQLYLDAIVIPDTTEPIPHIEDSDVSVDQPTTDSIKTIKTIQMEDTSKPEETPVVLPDPEVVPQIETGERICKIKKTFRLGKHPNKRVVSVFCKNIEMINGVKRIHSTLKNRKLTDMKKYLVRKSLISIGSTAPPDIITQMYVSAISSGDINNHNNELMLKNYMTHS